MTRVKACGTTCEDDLEAAVEAGADAVGLIAEVPVDTHREISPKRARSLAAAAPPFVTTVLVTMPETPAEAIGLVERVRPDAVQLHGTLEPDGVASVREAVDATVLVVLEAGETDAATAEAYDAVADGLLVDTPAVDGGGGTGETHNWEVTRELAAGLDSPLVLAGGLTPENVADAVRAVEPFAVDVASGIENAEGRTDPGAVRTFVERAKNVNVPIPRS
ncbi:phosphoribosylanthranilate isomerase [Natronococcus amylolyticus DSM 10524]|uniref:N-(5'-phosphoribosyl)anthranilate isomerase n=1 Tax=Natronococcus amylolyticus DSM 10524 TaxID=1227497 RepID=L9WWU0_9EURY|nr:phosphoribosylanthranilate isomerase [Natronococcus amylolyticus]ELY53935.1 phosphoribosylanthranilate isomerase [Natronococcus amylolyticus DSM 10524]